MASVMHIHPMADLIEHDTSTLDCVCIPEVRPVLRPDGPMGWLLIHHSLDGRERCE